MEVRGLLCYNAQFLQLVQFFENHVVQIPCVLVCFFLYRPCWSLYNPRGWHLRYCCFVYMLAFDNINDNASSLVIRGCYIIRCIYIYIAQYHIKTDNGYVMPLSDLNEKKMVWISVLDSGWWCLYSFFLSLEVDADVDVFLFVYYQLLRFSLYSSY